MPPLTAPKDPWLNRHYRAWLLWRCQDRPDFQRAVLERCRDDIVFWIDSFGWQYNPDKSGSEVAPFICHPFQETVIRRTMRRLLEFRRRVVWEKSRKLGATWMALFIEDHQCLLHGRKKFLNISHSEAAVYRPDDPDTLFWKLAFIHDHLPDWMTRGVVARKLSFWFPGTASSLTGSATTDRSGVGGRGTIIADEFSKHREDWAILGQTADTGPQLFIGTHYDMASAFYDLTQRPDTFKIVMHWSEFPERAQGLYRSDPVLPGGYEILDKSFHYPPQCPKCSGLVNVPVGDLTPCCETPARDYVFITDGKPTGGPHPGIRSPWYDAECVERGSERDVAMHLDINPQGSQSQYFDTILLRSRIAEWCSEPVWRGDIRFDNDSGKPIELVPDPEGPVKLWMHPKTSTEVPAGRYGGGADLSTGSGATPSVFALGDANTGVKVLELATAALAPDRFALAVCALGWLFKDAYGDPALIAWEENGPGAMFGKTLLGLGYRRVYHRQSEQLFRAAVRSDVPGWWNSPKSKRVLFDSYKAALVNRDFTNRSELALRECSQYRFSDRRDAVEHPKDVGGINPEEARSNHGDRVMADALCWMALQSLGAGKPAAQRQSEQATPIGSLAWRRSLHDNRRRED